MTAPFSHTLHEKISTLLTKRVKTPIGSLEFYSPLVMAPMASITTVPFRLLMQDLGAGATISELISCHGINYGNEKTLKMLKIHPMEKMTGIQLFGEEPKAMSEAAKKVMEFGPKFLDINMGCPVRKVVGKGGGSALMSATSKLPTLFSSMKNAIDVPLSIKIRTGWDEDNLNAKEIVHIAKEEGIEFVSIHGRTRAQQYRGFANWQFIENLAEEKILPMIGNGDLHSAKIIKEKLRTTHCNALMMGRGPLRNPFLFLESFDLEDKITFTAKDYLEIIERLLTYSEEYVEREKTLLIQMRKHIVWFASGFSNSAKFRGHIFKTNDLVESMKVTRDFFGSLEDNTKQLNLDEPFMTSGHG